MVVWVVGSGAGWGPPLLLFWVLELVLEHGLLLKRLLLLLLHVLLMKMPL